MGLRFFLGLFLYFLYALCSMRSAVLVLVISFQFTLGDDPSEMPGSHGFQTSVDTKGEMAVLSRNAKAEDIPQMDKAVYNIFPLFIVDWMNRTTLILGLLQPAI